MRRRGGRGGPAGGKWVGLIGGRILSRQTLIRRHSSLDPSVAPHYLFPPVYNIWKAHCFISVLNMSNTEVKQNVQSVGSGPQVNILYSAPGFAVLDPDTIKTMANPSNTIFSWGVYR